MALGDLHSLLLLRACYIPPLNQDLLQYSHVLMVKLLPSTFSNQASSITMVPLPPILVCEFRVREGVAQHPGKCVCLLFLRRRHLSLPLRCLSASGYVVARANEAVQLDVH